MATRLYFPSTGTPDVSPTINNGGEWEHSNGVRRPLVTTVGSSALSTDAYTPDATFYAGTVALGTAPAK